MASHDQNRDTRKSDAPVHLLGLVNALQPVNAKWWELGIQFGFTVNDLDGIRQSYQYGGVQQWMTIMLDMKLKRTPGFVWGDVAKALRGIGCEKHINCPQADLRQVLQPYIRKASPTGCELGSGSYGSVIELKSAGEVVAGKVFKNISRAHMEITIHKVYGEMMLLMQMHHPNVVESRGLCFLEQHPMPVLLMERLWSSLHAYLLDPSHQAMQLTAKMSILCDVASGLYYLHSHIPPVGHRDLTAKNVLLDSKLNAKIGDFGNARLMDLDPATSLQTFTSLPGTLEYMPPEAHGQHTHYNSSLDVFSFGHLALFTVVQSPVALLPPSYSDSEGDHLRPEVMRRQESMDTAEQMLKEKPTLVALIKGCLQNNPAQRPRTEKLVAELQQLTALTEGLKRQSSSDGSEEEPRQTKLKASEPQDYMYLRYLSHDTLDKGGDKVQVTMLVGGVKENTFAMNFKENHFEMQFQTLDEKFLASYSGSSSSTVFVWKVQLFGEIVPSGCSYEVKAANVKLSLQKAQPQRWKALETNQHLSSHSSTTAGSNSNATNQVTPTELPSNENASSDDDLNDLDISDEAEDTPLPSPQLPSPPQKQPEGETPPLSNPVQSSGTNMSRVCSTTSGSNTSTNDDWNDLDVSDEAEDTPSSSPQLPSAPQKQPEGEKPPLSNPVQSNGTNISRVHSTTSGQEGKGRNSTVCELHSQAQAGDTSVVSLCSVDRSSSSGSAHVHTCTCTHAPISLAQSKHPGMHTSPSQMEMVDPSYRDKQLRQVSTTGLSNAGNMSFMNSVIQCLSNTPELRDYFISGRYLANVNKENPMGFQGELAKCFSLILRKLWSGEYEYFPPKKLMTIIAKRSKQFDGPSQHDSHEFMSYLLDGLHEDLNRVRKKPMTKPVEIEGHPDREVAVESWTVYKMRNDSVIVDLFQGQFKSTLVCPDCNKESLTFDPFLSISVPIPRNLRRLPVIFFPQDPKCMPRQLILQLPNEATLELLKASVARRTSLSMFQLRVFEAYQGRFQTLMFFNRQPISVIGEKDIIIVSEVLSKHNVQDEVVEVYIIQRVQVPPFPTKCGYCSQEAEGRRKLQRCSNCKAVGYCNRQCQTKHWSEHRLNCKGGQPSTVGLPFVISLPAKQLTLTRLMEYAEKFASHSVTVERKEEQPLPGPAQGEATPNTEDIDTSIQQSTDSMQESGKNPQNPGDSMQGITRDMQNSVESMQECAESMQKKPMYTLIQVNRFADSIPGAKPLEDLGDKPLSFDDKRVYLAMDWRNNPKDANSVVVTTKSTLDYVRDSLSSLELTRCLQLFTEPETLSKDEAWYCPRCKEHKEATKQMSVWRLPRYLIIHLKRFSFHNYVERSKIDDYVSFPLHGLDMSPYLLGDAINEIPPGAPPVYDLYGTVNHYGNVNKGHNVAMVKPPDKEYQKEKEWLCYDDEKVWRVDEDKVVSREAYVLFYHHRGTMTSS